MKTVVKSSVVLGAICCLLLLNGCCQSFGGDEPGSGEVVPTPTPPAPPSQPPPPGTPSAPEKRPGTQVVFGPGGSGPGGMQVTTDGQNVWPPTGAGCERYVQCCNAATALAPDVALFCQMAVATPPVDCSAAHTRMRTYLGERGLAVPQACQE